MPAIDGVKELLGSHDERLRNTACRALVELLPVERLPEIAQAVAGDHELRLVADRLLDRLDLDAGIALAAHMHQMLEITGWLLERLTESAPPEAWTPARVDALMVACGKGSIGCPPDPLVLAGAIGHHPKAAIAAVRVTTGYDGRPTAPPVQLLALNQLDASVLRGDEHAPLRAAVADALEQQKQLRTRREAPARALATLAARLDEAGHNIKPSDVRGPLRLRDLEDRHKDLLATLVDRWWPKGSFPAADDELTKPAAAALYLGAELEPPLSRERWIALLDAYLSAREWRQPELAANGVHSWLSRRSPADAERLLSERIGSAPDGGVLSKLFALAGRRRAPPAVRDAAFDRLAELDPGERGWLNAVGILLEDGDLAPVQKLLDRPMPDPAREHIFWRLARRGDANAQEHVAKRLASELHGGEGTSDEAPSWDTPARDPAVRDALALVISEAIEHQHPRLASFAVQALADAPDEDGLNRLTALEATHGGLASWLTSWVEQLTRQIATQRVLQRLPKRLDDVVVAFDAAAMPNGASVFDLAERGL